jgi:hypothetical protein
VRRPLAGVVLALLLAGGAGCGGGEALDASRAVVARWFDALAEGDTQAALSLYTESVAQGEGAEPMRARLGALARLGAPDAREELAWSVHARVRDEGTGWFVTLVERASWEECSRTLRFHLYRPFGGGGEARLLGHERAAEQGCEEDGIAV